MTSPKRFSATINVNVTLDVWARIQALSEVTGELKSNVVRKIIKDGLVSVESTLDAGLQDKFHSLVDSYTGVF